MVKYKTIDDVPEWYRSEVQELMDAGALKGTGNGAIDISEDVVRGAIIGMRYVKAKTRTIILSTICRNTIAKRRRNWLTGARFAVLAGAT